MSPKPPELQAQKEPPLPLPRAPAQRVNLREQLAALRGGLLVRDVAGDPEVPHEAGRRADLGRIFDTGTAVCMHSMSCTMT